MLWGFIGIVTKLIAFITGLLYLKRLPQAYKVLAIQTSIAMLVEAIGFYTGYFLNQNNLWIFNIYALIELCLLTYIGIQLSDSHLLKKLYIPIVLLFTAYWGLFICLQGIHVMPVTFILTIAFFFILLYAYILLSNLVFKKNKIISQPLFLLSVSIIIYYASIIPLFGLFNSLIEGDIGLAEKLYDINRVANSLRYVLVGLVFYLYARQVTKNKLTELPDE